MGCRPCGKPESCRSNRFPLVGETYFGVKVDLEILAVNVSVEFNTSWAYIRPNSFIPYRAHIVPSTAASLFFTTLARTTRSLNQSRLTLDGRKPPLRPPALCASAGGATVDFTHGTAFVLGHRQHRQRSSVTFSSLEQN